MGALETEVLAGVEGKIDSGERSPRREWKAYEFSREKRYLFLSDERDEESKKQRNVKCQE